MPFTEVDVLRHDYESSLSWRVTRPLRAAGRLARALRGSEVPPPAPAPESTANHYDSWLDHFHGDRLARIDAACADGRPEAFALFRELDVDLWALLLTQEYRLYPNIRALLPQVPEASLQELWNGTSGVPLAAQSAAFYRKVCERYAQYSERPLAEGRVLDFGCGWGRLTRFFARDVAPGHLFGCDPVQEILDVCAQSGVPAQLARSDFLPERIPFDEQFDLAFSFSVFTHISEAAHERCLQALHDALRPGGLLVVTVRPPEYVLSSMGPMRDALGDDPRARLQEARFVFEPHPADPSHHQYEGGEMTYGEAVITLPYIRERWSEMFELLDVGFLIGDLHQVMLTLRRR